MNGHTIAFVVLVANQFAATAVFMAVYGIGSRWRDSPVGRAVMFWSAAGAALDVSWLLLLVWQRGWLLYVLLVAQGLVGLLTWQRVYLVWRAQHADD